MEGEYSRGGNDTLNGGHCCDQLPLRRRRPHADNARGGNDTLISGTGTDHMWGDAQIINGVAASPTAPTGTVMTGADTFVFAPGNGNDDINDFRQSDHDRIDVSAYGVHNIADMMITFTGWTPRSPSTPPTALPFWASPVPCSSSDFLFAS